MIFEVSLASGSAGCPADSVTKPGRKELVVLPEISVFDFKNGSIVR